MGRIRSSLEPISMCWNSRKTNWNLDFHCFPACQCGWPARARAFSQAAEHIHLDEELEKLEEDPGKEKAFAGPDAALCWPGYWRITKPHWRACWRWLQKDGNTFWWIEQKPHRHGLHKDVFWRTNCGTSNSHILLDYAVVPWPTSPWTSCCSLPSHYLCATVKYGRISCCFTFGSHICDWWSYIFHYMKAEKFALFQIVCCFVMKFISGCCFKLNSTLDNNRVEYTFCSLFKSLVLLLWSVPTFKHPTLVPNQILTPPKVSRENNRIWNSNQVVENSNKIF